MRKILLRCTVIALATVCFCTQRALAAPTLVLPQDVDMKAWHPGPQSYWDTYLYDFPAGDYDVEEGRYIGWCVSESTYMYAGHEYTVDLYSSYDPSMPSYFQDPEGDWDKVNYIINNKQGTWLDVQQAIWKFIDGGHDPVNEAGKNMVEAANLYGEGFEPGYGQSIAVLCDAGPDVQHTFVEVEVSPVPEASTLILFGTGLSGLMFMVRRKGWIKV